MVKEGAAVIDVGESLNKGLDGFICGTGLGQGEGVEQCFHFLGKLNSLV